MLCETETYNELQYIIVECIVMLVVLFCFSEWRRHWDGSSVCGWAGGHCCCCRCISGVELLCRVIGRFASTRHNVAETWSTNW